MSNKGAVDHGGPAAGRCSPTLSHGTTKPLAALGTPEPWLKCISMNWGPLGLDLDTNIFRAFQAFPNSHLGSHYIGITNHYQWPFEYCQFYTSFNTLHLFGIIKTQTVGDMPEILPKHKTLYKIKGNFTSHLIFPLAPWLLALFVDEKAEAQGSWVLWGKPLVFPQRGRME